MQTKWKWLIGVVVLCCVVFAGIGLRIAVRSCVEAANNERSGGLRISGLVEAPPEGFEQIPAYSYMTERRGGTLTCFKLTELPLREKYGLSAEDYDKIQVVVLRLNDSYDTLSAWERILLSYPLERLPMDSRFGPYARLLGDRHVAFVYERLVFHISAPVQMENRAAFLGELADHVFDRLGPQLPLDWLIRVAPDAIGMHGSRLWFNVYRTGGSVSQFKAAASADFMQGLALPVGSQEPVQVTLIEMQNAEEAKQAASRIVRMFAAGVFDGSGQGLGQTAFIIGDRSVVFTEGRYAVRVTVDMQMENRLDFVLDVARQIDATLEGMLAEQLHNEPWLARALRSLRIGLQTP